MTIKNNSDEPAKLAINEEWRAEVLKLADHYCTVTDTARTVLSIKIAKDADFLDHLANGGGCTVDKLQRIITWFKDNPPKERADDQPPGRKRKTKEMTQSAP